MIRLSDLVLERQKLSRDAFAATWSMPVLLHREEREDEEERAFKTGITDPRGSRLEIEAGLTTKPDLAVIKVQKRAGSPFQERISVGRSRNSDIHIDYPKISKFHAYFSPSDLNFLLTDAGSTNGTFVNNHRLTADQPVILPDRALVSFGRYHFRFHLPKGLVQIVEELTFGP